LILSPPRRNMTARHEQHLVEDTSRLAAIAGPCDANSASPHRYTAPMASYPNSMPG
jgi:hypothetical protein